MVGNEWDTIQAGSPGNIQTLGTTPVVGADHGAGVANTTIYVAPSGALVFAAGGIAWTWGLDSYRFFTPTGAPLVVAQMQTLMANIMGALKGPVFSMVGV